MGDISILCKTPVYVFDKYNNDLISNISINSSSFKLLLYSVHQLVTRKKNVCLGFLNYESIMALFIFIHKNFIFQTMNFVSF